MLEGFNMDRQISSSMSEMEDMVTVSLNEVLASRNRFLEESEFWALCRECCLTLEYVHDCHDLFQSLCISPDTVAFDPEGNVCFLDLDMEPEPLYIAPELAESGSSFKSHLFSLGMTLLFATEYNSESHDPKSELSDNLTDLLAALTSDECDLRPDLDTVIDICDKALDGELSQIICLNIVGLKGTESPVLQESKPDSSLQQVTDELTAYLQSQSGFVQSPTGNADDSIYEQRSTENNNDGTNAIKSTTLSSTRDHNDNCVVKFKQLSAIPASIRDIIKEASPDEDDMMATMDDTNPAPPRRTKKKQGIMLADLLRSLNRYLDENELWALCRECAVSLQRKKKHLPAYISPETVMVCESGTIAFKAIPEEKPLEVVYMAPELQQKGTLNEKTCLYGLGITLRKAAGVKLNCSSLSITDGEALEILINSFLQTNPERRPNLETAFEMCEEYEKVNDGTSRETCIKIYSEAFESVMSCKNSKANAKNQAIDQKHSKDSSNSWDSSELEQTQMSSDNTQSIAQGDTTEAEESIDELPPDFPEDDTTALATSAFKPLSGGKDNKWVPPSSAFKPLSIRSVPNAKEERVPSAFSSPATHFKPIILHESTGNTLNQKKSDGDVVSKLREIKQNLLKKRAASDDSSLAGSLTNPQEKLSQNSARTNKAEPSNSSELGNYIKHLKSQGQMPDTDTLASAIAKYLQREMSDSQVEKSTPEKTSETDIKSRSVKSAQAASNQNPHFSQLFTPKNFNEKHKQSEPSFQSSVTTHIQSTTPQTTYPQPPFLMSHAHPVIQGCTEIHSGAISHAHPYQLPSSHVGSSHSMQYNAPISGVAAANMPPVQFTLMQDPLSGFMQMVPISYLPISHPLGPIPSDRSPASSTFTSSATSNLGAQLYHERTVVAPTSQQAFTTHFEKNDSHAISQGMDHITSKHQRHPQGTNFYAAKSSIQGDQMNFGKNEKSNLDQTTHSQREEDNHSRSSSPSPSKDSGICLTQQSYYKDTLVDKYLSSGHSNRQQVLSRVLGIIREEFAEDGVLDSGVEDLAIAEYILSLSALKWDTFSCAVREKYSHLIWTGEVLMILHEVITDSRPAQSKSSQPGEHRRSYMHSQEEKDIKKNEMQLLNQQSLLRQQADIKHKMISSNGNQNMGMLNIPSTNQGLNRPRSELARTMVSSASDSTDSETTDKRPRYRKRYNLDKGKSSSLHNVAHQGEIDNDSCKSYTDKAYSPPIMINKKPIESSMNKINNPSVFSKEYYSGSKNRTNSSLQKDDVSSRSSASVTQKNHNNSSYTEIYSSSLDKPPSFSHNAWKPPSIQSAQHIFKQNQSGTNSGQHYPLLPSKNHHNSSSSHYLPKSKDQLSSTPSLSPRLENSLSPSFIQQPNYLAPYNRAVREAASSSPFQMHDNQQLNKGSKANGPFTGDHSIHGHQVWNNHNVSTPHQQETSIRNLSSSSLKHNSKYIYDDEDDHEDGSDADFNSSAEMRKLAAKKPELYERRTPSLATPIDRNMGSKSVTSQVSASHLLNTSRDSQLAVSQFKISENNGDNINNNYTLPHNSSTNASTGQSANKRSENLYKRSMSAIYSLETGVKVSDKKYEYSHQRRGSDGSADLPPVNSALLPYVKKGQVVYHSAMIQLSLTPEVDRFIHSIDEENKSEIESQLSSLSQEINMQWRQRRKTQRFFKRLSEQNPSKASKGDQNVSDQMLKDMAEMTRKLSFLNLCRTHLQMLLAELNGLDVCYLHSLSVCDGQNQLVLEPLMENKYLQFRTFSTQEAGSMSILQAGTPKGLLSYLYTSSALSDGYIHQFLLCFRYILTAEQMFSFIIDKCKSAQRSKPTDKNILRIQHRSFDLLQFWIEGYFSIDFIPNTQLTKKLGQFIQDQISINTPGAQELYSLYAACRLNENTELMIMTEMEEDDENDNTYFIHMANPKQWESFRSLLKRSKSDKSLNSSGGIIRQKASEAKTTSSGPKSASQFSLSDVEVHTLAEQLTLLEQDLFRKCHPVHFLNSQFHGIGVALSMSGLRTPSMSRKMEPIDAKRGLFVGDPSVESNIGRMISHSHDLAHWVSAEILSCGSGKAGVIQKFISVAHMCLEVRNFASALSIYEGLDNLVVKQLPVWKNIPSKCLSYMEDLTEAKMKLKSESMWLTKSKDFHIYPTIPYALFATLHLQQLEIGGFTLANGMYKWDKMRSISETVDQLRIFRDHEYGFHSDPSLQRMLQRRLNEFSDQDLHAVASTHENNFRRHSSSSSLSGTLKKFKDRISQKGNR